MTFYYELKSFNQWQCQSFFFCGFAVKAAACRESDEWNLLPCPPHPSDVIQLGFSAWICLSCLLGLRVFFCHYKWFDRGTFCCVGEMTWCTSECNCEEAALTKPAGTVLSGGGSRQDTKSGSSSEYRVSFQVRSSMARCSHRETSQTNAIRWWHFLTKC